LPSWLLGQAALRAQRIGAEQFAAAGAHRSEYAVLSALDEFGPASQIELGRRCGFDRSDVVAIVNELVHNKFVERRTDRSDRRRNVITLTAAGRRQLVKLDSVTDAIQDELLEGLSDRERDQLSRLLGRLVAN
jgi:DNA-binding MarR family transcriptional regulator